MPWKATSPLDLRVHFISRLKAGERMSDLCQEFGISRKTGHKLKNRYEQLGAAGLADQSRAPKTIPHRTSPEIEALVVAERHKHPTWGPKKLKEVLEQRIGRPLPSASTMGDILQRAGLIEPRARRRRQPCPTNSRLTQAAAPNDVWAIDYKGQFRLGDGSYCYPLTATDLFSRYILCCDGMPAISDADARDSFSLAFGRYGVPAAIRSDNGVPFASTGLAGLTQLSAYFIRLGIRLERIRPGHPQENGQHERMHRTLKSETTRPARPTLLQQQELFDAFMDTFNTERPHEAIGMKRPADLYAKSRRTLENALTELHYPLHDDVLLVNTKGFIRLPRERALYLSKALAGYTVGLREEDDGRLTVTFVELELGHIDSRNSFIPKASVPPEAA